MLEHLRMTISTHPDFSDSACYFWGQVAFAKSIDKSPAHDPKLQALLTGKTNRYRSPTTHPDSEKKGTQP